MKTIKNIINESAVGTLSNSYKYAVICLFSGIVVTVVSLLVFMFTNMAHVSASFNF
ncbi:MAG: hypothetical protein ABJN95_12220 [Maribacter sp.]|uniref:hypothetical protein n=1 Tax=Maribacter sp. TaxID=1897614 RepID=UPI0032993C4F